MRAVAFVLVFAMVGAGCVTAPEGGEGTSQPGPGPDRVVAHTAQGSVAPPDLPNVTFRLEGTGHHRGEPTIGVLSDGMIFTVGEDGAAIASTDHGRTWRVVDDPATRPKPDIDPFLWVDKTTDRVYNSRLHIACTWLSWTDDQGASWTPNPVAGCRTPGHDHQKVTTGPPPEGVATTGYPNLVYYVYNSFRGDGTFVLVSRDGGLTWPVEQNAPPASCRGGIAGPVAVGPGGAAYLPKYTCDGLGVSVSRDGGESWTAAAELTDHGAPPWGIDPMADVDEAGNVHAVWQADTGELYLASSRDQGDTWTTPLRVSAPGVNSTVFPDVAAGADGRLAVSYLGTTADDADWPDHDPSYAPDDVVWHLWVGYVEDAFAADPVVVSHRATPDDDPVQIGCIWHHGGTEACRNLRDFNDMVHHEGRLFIVYADGCAACDDAADSRDAETTVAILEEGPSLLDGGLLGRLPQS